MDESSISIVYKVSLKWKYIVCWNNDIFITETIALVIISKYILVVTSEYFSKTKMSSVS